MWFHDGSCMSREVHVQFYERAGVRFPCATHRNIYVGSQAAAQRVLASITQWLSKHLRLEVNAAKSGVGRPWERKFLGFRVDPAGKIEVAPRSLERFQDRGRELWRGLPESEQ